MAKVTVPRAEVAELLGLSPDVSDEELHKAFADAAAALDAKKRGQAADAEEQRLRAEDRRLVNAAYNDGRIVNRDNWAAILATNRRENRALLASLACGLPPEQKVTVDEGLETTHRKVLSRLGIQPAPASPRTVAASESPQADQALYDVLGQKMPPAIPAPVVIRKGVDPADYTREQQYSDFAHKLGPVFSAGVPRPPAGDTIFIPSPNDPYRWDEAAGRFVEKNPYREI
jgi:hypothetical protein